MYFSIYLVFKISSSIEIRRNKLDISLKEEEEEKKKTKLSSISPLRIYLSRVYFYGLSYLFPNCLYAVKRLDCIKLHFEVVEQKFSRTAITFHLETLS